MGSKLIALLMLPFYTKWLSVDEFGTTDNVMIYVTLLFGLFTLSISESIFIFPKGEELQNQKRYFTSGMIFTLLFLTGFIGLMTICKMFLSTYQILNSFTSNFHFIAPLICITFIQNYLQQFTRSINKIKIYTWSGVILTLMTAIFSFILIPTYKVYGFFLAQIGAYTISSFYTFIASRTNIFFNIKSLDWSFYKKMAMYSIPLIPNAMIWWIISSLNRPILEEEIGLYAIGIFAVGNKLPTLINVIFSVFISSWQISALEESKKADYSIFYNQIFKIVVTTLTIMVMFLTFFGKFLNTIIADPKFFEAWKLIPYLSLSAFFSSISGFVGSNFLIIKKSKYFFYSSFWGAIAAIILNYLFIPKMGVIGAVIANTSAHIVLTTSRIYYSWKFAKITNINYYILLTILIILSILITFFISNMFYGILFFILILTIMGFTLKEDLSIIKRIIHGEISQRKNK